MIYCLDTNICIYFLNNRRHGIYERLREIPRGSIKIPAVVTAELYYGAAKSAMREYNLRIYSQFIAMYDIIPFDLMISRAYGDIRAALERRGQMIGGNDIMIAASALCFGAVLVTNNVREFSRVDGLFVENWTQV
jgi:tRNA(fMet)-specific endonuclease VapC